MAVATFVLMEMRRSGHAANIQARHSNDPHEHRHLAFALARIAPALMLMILIFGAALFFIMPRMFGGRISGRLFARTRPFLRIQRSRAVGKDRSDPAIECRRHAHPDRRRHRRPLRPTLARCRSRRLRRAHLVESERTVLPAAPARQQFRGASTDESDRHPAAHLIRCASTSSTIAC